MLGTSVSCIILHFAPHTLHILILAHLYASMLDHDEPELEEQV
jgi:hypothetical protein